VSQRTNGIVSLQSFLYQRTGRDIMFVVSIEDKRDITAKEILKDSVFLEYIHCLCLCGHVRYYHSAIPISGDVVSGNCEHCQCKGFILRKDQLQLDSKDIINYFLGKK
jgi:hypothetical protein